MIEDSQRQPGRTLRALHSDLHEPGTLIPGEQRAPNEAKARHPVQEEMRKPTETVSQLISQLPVITIIEAPSVGRTEKSLI